jgi:serine/threonine protein kinase
LRTKIASSVANCHNLGAKLVTYQWNLPYSSSEIIRRLELLDEDDVVGSGGFGTVYKMVMDDGTAFAVKRIDLQRESRDRTFEKELEILGSIRHINLVNLRGYCRLPTAKLLIYDFVELGSLDCYLHGKQISTSTIVTIFNTRCVAYVMCC